MNNCCGRVNMKIPDDIPAGDYLLRAEVVALHVAGQLGGAQLYMSCCMSPRPSHHPNTPQLTLPLVQLTISGGGSAAPELVEFPGAYAATDPGIQVDIYQSLATYIAPGPTVYGGFTKSAGDTCAGVETGTETGPAYTGGDAPTPTTNVGAGPTTTGGEAPTSVAPTSGGEAPTSVAPTSGGEAPTSVAPTSGGEAPTSVAPTTQPPTSVAPTSGGAEPTSTGTPGGGTGCASPKYGQCGGEGWTGCTECEDGSTCQDVSPPYYSQCT
jgi:cellulase